MVTSCFLNKQWNRGGDADQCVVDAVFSERMQRNTFEKEAVSVSAEVTKDCGLRSADAAQHIKGLYWCMLFKKFVPSAQVAHLLFRGFWLLFILAQYDEHLPHFWKFPS